MCYFKKNLLKFSNTHIHSMLKPILKTWVPFYSLELEEFENLFSPPYSNFFVRNVRLGKENNFILQYAAMSQKYTDRIAVSY